MKKSELDEVLRHPVTTVPKAGDALGLSRNKSYQAAAAAQIPTIRIGKALRVPTAWLKRTLGLDAE